MPLSRFPALMATAVTLSTLSLATLTLPAQAQEAAPDHYGLTIGAGTAYVPSYDGSNDYELVPVVQARGKVDDFAFWTRGTSFYFDAIPNRSANGWDVELGPAVNLNRNRTNRIKDQQVSALGKLDTAIEVGGFAGIAKTGVITSAYDTLSFNVSAMKDVNKAHESYIISPSIEYFTPLSVTTFVGLSASANYVGKGYGRYYFDVTPAGSTASGLPVYSGAGDKAGFKNASLNLTAGKSLSGDLRHGWAIFALGGYSKLLGAYKRSPIVAIAGNSNQWIAAVGVGYTF